MVPVGAWLPKQGRRGGGVAAPSKPLRHTLAIVSIHIAYAGTASLWKWLADRGKHWLLCDFAWEILQGSLWCWWARQAGYNFLGHCLPIWQCFWKVCIEVMLSFSYAVTFMLPFGCNLNVCLWISTDIAFCLWDCMQAHSLVGSMLSRGCSIGTCYATGH